MEKGGAGVWLARRSPAHFPPFSWGFNFKFPTPAVSSSCSLTSSTKSGGVEGVAPGGSGLAQIPAPPLTSCVILGNSLNSSELQFPPYTLRMLTASTSNVAQYLFGKIRRGGPIWYMVTLPMGTLRLIRWVTPQPSSSSFPFYSSSQRTFSRAQTRQGSGSLDEMKIKITQQH